MFGSYQEIHQHYRHKNDEKIQERQSWLREDIQRASIGVVLANCVHKSVHIVELANQHHWHFNDSEAEVFEGPLRGEIMLKN